MKSPFPGMDPYLEAHWLDVQVSLVTYARDQLQRQLGEDLVARAEERVVVEDAGGTSRRIGPDVRVVEHGQTGQGVQPGQGPSAASPMVFELEAEPIVERYLEIRDLSTGGSVVTVIEFVSPTNKLPGDGREKYQQKQRECRAAGVNLVEIDLTRTERRELLAHRWAGTRLHDSTYQVSVWRGARPSRCELYAIRLQDRLPSVRVPLRATDPDVVLDLQSLIEAAYEASRYGRTIDYRRACQPPLAGEELAWAAERLQVARR